MDYDHEGMMGSMGAQKARHRVGGASAAGQLLPLLPTQPIECQHGHSHGNGQMCHGHFENPASPNRSTLTRTLSEFMNECATGDDDGGDAGGFVSLAIPTMGRAACVSIDSSPNRGEATVNQDDGKRGIAVASTDAASLHLHKHLLRHCPNFRVYTYV